MQDKKSTCDSLHLHLRICSPDPPWRLLQSRPAVAIVAVPTRRGNRGGWVVRSVRLQIDGAVSQKKKSLSMSVAVSRRHDDRSLVGGGGAATALVAMVIRVRGVARWGGNL